MRWRHNRSRATDSFLKNRDDETRERGKRQENDKEEENEEENWGESWITVECGCSCCVLKSRWRRSRSET